MINSNWRLTIILAAFAGAFASTVGARIKLITLPPRERVEIQLDNPAATLVEEERIVPLVKGDNQVDFSWANTQINPDTILFRVLAPAAGADKTNARVLSVSYPPNEASLVWAVASDDSGSARVRISYILGNLSKTFAYRAIAAHDEKTLALSQYMRLDNLANEEYANTEMWAGFGKEFLKPIGINETKEMLVARHEKVPVVKTYTASVDEFGYTDQPQNKLRIPMHYVIKNDKAGNLGLAALPAGKARIFIEGAGNNQATTFLGEDWGHFTPIDDQMRLYLGVAQDVSVKRTIDRNERKRVAGNLFDQTVTIRYEIENFKDSPVSLDVVESMRHLRNEVHGETGRDVQWELGNDTTFANGPDKEHSTFDRLMFHVNLPARAADGKAEKIVQKLQVVLRNEW